MNRSSVHLSSLRPSRLLGGLAGLGSWAVITLAVAGFAHGAAPSDLASDGDYRREIEAWRADRETRLRSDTGWLTVAGLFWLKEGKNTLGNDPRSDVLLPPGVGLPQTGFLLFSEGEVQLKVFPDATVLLGDQAVTSRTLADDASGAADLLKVGRVTFHLIRRQDRLGIRLRDPESQARREFAGCRWYPVDPAHRVEAKFVPYDPPRTIAIPNVLGQVSEESCPGYVEFQIDGQTARLEPTAEPGDESWSFIFSDGTSGVATYGGGRFLESDPAQNGVVVLDFNRAYNPPCVFTPYATCPLPPESNRLTVEIRAGELNYGEHH
ncbi:MAG: DUF1684 domain-containing protein [Candidatus Eisenbacteria bacterium]|nr:DUF1684 domain-containing protein [Candidatus Eisenbacteria bacterium]